MKITVNGQPRSLEGIGSPASLKSVLETLGLRADRIAVELNGEIAPRTLWDERTVADGDRIEIVHFVGGGRR
ncbi:MAG TPA: sulfur carrier protein ThiS [Acidobacteriaceae bacterium]